jgi:multidrug resistance efflux pump
VQYPHAAATPPAADHEGVVCFGTVDLEHGVSALSPLQPGRVVEILAAENQQVKEGAELLRLDDAVSRSKLAAAEASVKLALVGLDQARKQPELNRIRIAQQYAMCQAAASRVVAARNVLARQNELAKSVVIPDSDKAITVEKVREMEALERAEEERLTELKAHDVAAESQRAEAELTAARARRDEAQIAVLECHLRAPCPGTVLRILVGPGDVLGTQPGQPAVLFAADGLQIVRATVEQEFAPRIKEGTHALVRDEANPSTAWRGKVGRMASWYSQRRTVLHDPSQLSDVRTLECEILLEPGQPPLRLGQSVRVSIGRIP